jgi:hypothetical protein
VISHCAEAGRVLRRFSLVAGVGNWIRNGIDNGKGLVNSDNTVKYLHMISVVGGLLSMPLFGTVLASSVSEPDEVTPSEPLAVSLPGSLSEGATGSEVTVDELREGKDALRSRLKSSHGQAPDKLIAERLLADELQASRERQAFRLRIERKRVAEERDHGEFQKALLAAPGAEERAAMVVRRQMMIRAIAE